MNKRILIYPLIFIFIISFKIRSTYSGEESFYFETARSIAMGSANTSIYNPANLADILCKTISLHGVLQRYSWGLSKFSLLGASLHYVQPHWSVSLSRIETGDRQEIERYDSKGNPVSTKEKWLFQEQFLSISYGRKICSNLAIGLNLKYNRSGFAIKYFESNFLKEQNGLSFDIGLLYHMNKKISFDLTAKNIIHSKFDYFILDYVTSIAIVNELPDIMNFGINYRPTKRIKLAFNVHNIFEDEIQDHSHNNKFRFNRSYHFGSEFKFIQKVLLRFGFKFEEIPIVFPISLNTPLTYKKQFTFTTGAGLNLDPVVLNFAIDFDQGKKELEKYNVPISDNTFRYGFSISWKFTK